MWKARNKGVLRGGRIGKYAEQRQVDFSRDGFLWERERKEQDITEPVIVTWLRDEVSTRL